MAVKNVLVCKGTDLTPYLRSYQVSIMDLDSNTTRTADGTLIRNRIATKRKISVQFKPLTQAEATTVLNAVSDVFFQVTFIDPQAGSTTRNMYVSDRSTPALGLNDILWQNISFELTEQ